MSQTSTVLRAPQALEAQRPAAHRGHWPQVLLVCVAIGIYFTARGLTEADPGRAVAHARRVVEFEQWARLYREPELQQLVIGHDSVVAVLNWIYIWGHWPVIAMVLIWLLRCHREPYRLLRNALFISGTIGVVIFILFPVAPPRLAGLGFVDTVSLKSHSYRVLQPPGFVNQYAAVPSLHVGWNLLIGISVARHARAWLARLFGLLIPIAMTASVVLTANHYLVDALLGAIVALVGLLAASWLMRRA
jgi:hypothetical protein